MTAHSVGGSSSMTGAKLSERTCFGSTEGRSGGSMKLLMMPSKALKMAPGSVVGDIGRRLLIVVVVVVVLVLMSRDWGEDTGGGVVVVSGIVVVEGGFSSILTEDTFVMVVKLCFLGKVDRRFLVANVEMNVEDKASIFVNLYFVRFRVGLGINKGGLFGCRP